MKLELNFMKDRDGNPCVVISSPSIENAVIEEIYCEDYDHIMDILTNPEATEDELKEIVGDIAGNIKEDDPKEHLAISVWRKKLENGGIHCGMLAAVEDGWGGIESGTTTDISNKEYKKFCKGSTMQKIDIAYHAYKVICPSSSPRSTTESARLSRRSSSISLSVPKFSHCSSSMV